MHLKAHHYWQIMIVRTLAAILLSICVWFNLAYGQAPFFQGKTITVVVGYQAGDGYDIWSRLLAAHMGKHIAGNPGLIAQNMPGAGSMIAANHIFNVAKADGLTMGSIGPSLYLDQLVGKKEEHFDWSKFGWVGSTESTPWLLYMCSNTPYKTIDDVRKAKEPPKCSATGTGTSGAKLAGTQPLPAVAGVAPRVADAAQVLVKQVAFLRNQELAEVAADAFFGDVAERTGGGGIHREELAGQIVGADQAEAVLHEFPVAPFDFEECCARVAPCRGEIGGRLRQASTGFQIIHTRRAAPCTRRDSVLFRKGGRRSCLKTLYEVESRVATSAGA